MKFRKFISVVLISCFIFCCSIPVNASETQKNVILDESKIINNSYELAINALSLYNSAIFKYSDIDLSSYVEKSTLLSYLDNKIETLQLKSMQQTFNKINYIDSYNLLDYEIIDKLVKFNIQSISKYNYVDLPDIESSSSVIAEITVDSSTNLIVDWYMHGDMYDEEILGNNNDIKSIISMKSDSTNMIENSQKELYKVFDNYYSSLLSSQNMIEKNKMTAHSDEIQTKGVTSLNKSNIVAWANNNFDSYSPTSGGSGTPYYDFSDMAGNYDCTNFVSHALLAGGATKNTSSKGDTGWFFNFLSNRSSSWSGVSNLYNFLTRSSSTRGPKGSHTAYSFFWASSTDRPYDAGDVIQFHNNSIWRHSGIITGYYSPDGYNLGAVVVGRSGKYMFNDHEKADDVYPYEKRVIHLYANFN